MAEIETDDKPITFANVESIKLCKNTKGYNWEIRTLGIDIVRLAKLNEEMIKKYGDPQF